MRNWAKDWLLWHNRGKNGKLVGDGKGQKDGLNIDEVPPKQLLVLPGDGRCSRVMRTLHFTSAASELLFPLTLPPPGLKLQLHSKLNWNHTTSDGFKSVTVRDRTGISNIDAWNECTCSRGTHTHTHRRADRRSSSPTSLPASPPLLAKTNHPSLSSLQWKVLWWHLKYPS